MLRELEKAAAAFAPVDDVALRQWPVIATGNWGCGAFAPGIGTAWGFHMGFFFWAQIFQDQICSERNILSHQLSMVIQYFCWISHFFFMFHDLRNHEILKFS